MKSSYFNVQIEAYQDGTVRAAVIRSRQAERQPADKYKRDPGREIFSLWYGTEKEAQGAAMEALDLNK